MNYLKKVKSFITELIEENLDECYLTNWDKDDFTEEEMKYITLEMGKIDTDNGELHLWKFNYYNDNYRDLFNLYGEPTTKEYHYLIKEFVDKMDEYGISLNETFKEKKYEDVIELIICIFSQDMIYEFNDDRKEKIKEEIKQRKKAIITIQRAFRKYRYTPCYKFCKLVQTRNLFLEELISREDFEKYLDENNIIRNELEEQ